LNLRLQLVVVATAIGALLASCRERQEAVAAEVPTLEIKAEVTKPRTAIVVAPYDGRIATMIATEGTIVHAGDVIVTLANPTVERDLAYSRAQLALAEYRLRNASAPKRGMTSVDDDAAERVRVAQSIVQSRKARLDRYENLFTTHDITSDELENARIEYAAAKRDLNAERRAAQNVNVAQPGDPALLQLDVDRARAEAAVIEERQKQLRVVAPMNGVITRVLAAPGDAIYPRDPLVEVTDTSTLEVRGTIAPELLRHVRAGMPVDVKVFTVPPRRFSASIKTVAPPSDANGAMISVPVSNPDGVLQPGTSAIITVR
jgi:membrane fusion protein (multidrug efflux system)